MSFFVPPHRPRSSTEASRKKRKRDVEGDHDPTSGHGHKKQSGPDDKDLPSDRFAAGAQRASAGIEGKDPDQQSDEGEDDDNTSTRGAVKTAAPPSNSIPQKVKHTLSSIEVDDELAKLKPPIVKLRHSLSDHTVDQDTDRVTLRRQHMRVLTTVLHTSLLKGDYKRAGRAWSLLLRTETDGHSFDPRLYHRWAIGAEILAQQHPQMKSSAPDEDASTEPALLRLGFDESQGQVLETVKEYFEALKVLYVHNKSAPTATDPLDFYYALLSFWIYTISKRQRRGDPTVSTDGSESASEARHDAGVLNEARKIAAFLDSQLISPPFSENSTFVDLRRMVALWIADLADVGAP